MGRVFRTGQRDWGPTAPVPPCPRAMGVHVNDALPDSRLHKWWSWWSWRSDGPSASSVLWETVRMAGSVGQGYGWARAPVAVGRCRAAPGQAPAQGTGSLEDPSLEEQELEENSGWSRSRSWVSSSRAEPQPCLHCRLLPASGHQRPRPGLLSSSWLWPRRCEVSVSRVGPCPVPGALAPVASGTASSRGRSPGRAVEPRRARCGAARGPACGAVPRGARLLFLPGEFSAWPPSLLEAPPPWSAASSSRYLILGLCKREGGAWPCPALGSHPEGRARRPHLERSLKAGRAAPAQPVPAPCPRPAASSSWRGSWLSGQSCWQHPPRMTPVSMSAWPGTARHGTPGERPASLPPSPRASRRGGRGEHRPVPGAVGLGSIPGPSPGAGAASPGKGRRPRPRPARRPAPAHAPHCLAAKAGVCPSPALDAVNCTVGCQSDGDCESTLKCCPAACGKACQKPDEKPGTCPPVNPGIPMLGVCTNQCKTDANCSGIQKCCRNGCGKVSCVTPIH
uniref:WAP domain-containing protein n=1 Tax=Taeniopygia guttata TaxID=59729 RepID=A0A674H1A0_TAEGU